MRNRNSTTSPRFSVAQAFTPGSRGVTDFLSPLQGAYQSWLQPLCRPMAQAAFEKPAEAGSAGFTTPLHPALKCWAREKYCSVMSSPMQTADNCLPHAISVGYLISKGGRPDRLLEGKVVHCW